MQPFIIIAGQQIPAYGLMVVVGFLLSVSIVLLRCPKRKIPVDNQLYFISFILAFTLLGAKLLYLLQNYSQLLENISVIFRNWSSFLNYMGGGFVFYGGLIGGCIGAFCYAKFFNINSVNIAENFVPAIPMFHCCGRIGCFMAGCCYGIEYNGPLAVIYTEALGAPNYVSLFPIQLLEALMNLILFFFLLGMDKKFKKPLQNFGVYAILYGTGRFLLEFFRGDSARGVWILSTSQWISLFVLIPVGIYMLVCKTEKNVLIWNLLNGCISEDDNERKQNSISSFGNP